jgi:hypothetical protein
VAFVKILKVRVIIVKGSVWDTPEGRANIADQIARAERILGYKIEVEEYEVVDDPSLLKIDPAPWKQGDRYSDEEVAVINKYGGDDTVPLVFTDDTIGAALAVNRDFAADDDGLEHDGAVLEKDAKLPSMRNTVAHELGHLLSGCGGDHVHSDDPDNVMDPHARGDKFTEPWKGKADQHPYLK